MTLTKPQRYGLWLILHFAVMTGILIYGLHVSMRGSAAMLIGYLNAVVISLLIHIYKHDN